MRFISYMPKNFLCDSLRKTNYGVIYTLYIFFAATSLCVIELKDNNKFIFFSQTQQYFLFNLLATYFGH
jgi:hypothetical protein